MGGSVPFLAPIHQEFPVLVELRDARAVVAVGDEHRAVGKPGKIGGTVEMRAVGALHRRRADGLHQLLAVMSEFVDRVHMVVDDPDMFFRIVGIDGDEVRLFRGILSHWVQRSMMLPL